MDRETREALRFFSQEHERSFLSLEGRGRVLLSAPHAVLQTRDGRLKDAERYTGMLCLLLNRRLGVPCIFKTRNMGDDANHDPQSPYRDEVLRLAQLWNIRCVLDLHQLSPARPMALCIGTGNGLHLHGRDIVAPVRAAFEQRGLTPVTVDNPFSASAAHTVAATAAQSGICALQLEINTGLLMEDTPTERFSDVMEALWDAILNIDKQL